jgi:hypothetical protein
LRARPLGSPIAGESGGRTLAGSGSIADIVEEMIAARVDVCAIPRCLAGARGTLTGMAGEDEIEGADGIPTGC